MRLADVIPKLGGLPKINSFRCTDCGEVLTDPNDDEYATSVGLIQRSRREIETNFKDRYRIDIGNDHLPPRPILNLTLQFSTFYFTDLRNGVLPRIRYAVQFDADCIGEGALPIAEMEKIARHCPAPHGPSSAYHLCPYYYL
jgi:hypothetical protein